jgi:hypothetical protein
MAVFYATTYHIGRGGVLVSDISVPSFEHVQATCTLCDETMSWEEANTHLCRWVTVEFAMLLPRQDVDIEDEKTIFDITEGIAQVLGPADYNKVTIKEHPRE